MANEKDNFGNHERGFDKENLRDIAAERQKELANERERQAGEKSPENLEDARHEAIEQASKGEKERKNKESKETTSAERRGPASKRERDASFNVTMGEVRSQMSAPSRAFSKVIHNPAVEKASDAVGGTIARPNASLSGSVTAFLFTLVIYLVARYYGYPLSGAETIASFALGWVIGMLIDYFRLIISGKR
jgi:hypothetical protein